MLLSPFTSVAVSKSVPQILRQNQKCATFLDEANFGDSWIREPETILPQVTSDAVTKPLFLDPIRSSHFVLFRHKKRALTESRCTLSLLVMKRKLIQDSLNKRYYFKHLCKFNFIDMDLGFICTSWFST